MRKTGFSRKAAKITKKKREARKERPLRMASGKGNVEVKEYLP
ncbi:MAG: hypothetical protein ACUZ8N_03810 [Candidatus Scalindua sp.]